MTSLVDKTPYFTSGIPVSQMKYADIPYTHNQIYNSTPYDGSLIYPNTPVKFVPSTLYPIPTPAIDTVLPVIPTELQPLEYVLPLHGRYRHPIGTWRIH